MRKELLGAVVIFGLGTAGAVWAQETTDPANPPVVEPTTQPPADNGTAETTTPPATTEAPATDGTAQTTTPPATTDHRRLCDRADAVGADRVGRSPRLGCARGARHGGWAVRGLRARIARANGVGVAGG